MENLLNFPSQSIDMKNLFILLALFFTSTQLFAQNEKHAQEAIEISESKLYKVADDEGCLDEDNDKCPDQIQIPMGRVKRPVDPNCDPGTCMLFIIKIDSEVLATTANIYDSNKKLIISENVELKSLKSPEAILRVPTKVASQKLYLEVIKEVKAGKKVAYTVPLEVKY